MSLYCVASLNFAGSEGVNEHKVNILDARVAVPPFSQSGFELLNQPTSVTDWHEPAQVARCYDEIESLCRARTGCDWVLFYPLLCRDPESAGEQADMQPILSAHSDYTEGYRAMLETDDHPYRAILAPSMARAGVDGQRIRDAARIATLQFWRNVGEAEVDYPLCLGDARTFRRESLTAVEVTTYGGLQTQFESFLVANEPGQRWYTFPRMTPDELLVFRAYDSEQVAAGEHFWTPHCAFKDTGPEQPAPRRSVETRAICGFDR